jgi:hypothetical protein
VKIIQQTIIEQVLNLHKQGKTKHQISVHIGISRYDVEQIFLMCFDFGKISSYLYRCKDCGCLLYKYPCLICSVTNIRSAVNTNISDLPLMELNLKPPHFMRYKRIRKKVSEQISSGLRLPLSAITDK